MSRPWDDTDDSRGPERTDEEPINEAKRHAELLRQRVEELKGREPCDLDLARELEFLDNLKRAWIDGDGKSLASLTAVLDYCQRNHRPLPDWAWGALRAILDMPEKKRRGRLASMRKQDEQNEIDCIRHGLDAR